MENNTNKTNNTVNTAKNKGDNNMYYEYRQSRFPTNVRVGRYQTAFLFNWYAPDKKSGNLEQVVARLRKEGYEVFGSREPYLYKRGDIWFKLRATEATKCTRLIWDADYERYSEPWEF